MCWMILPKLFTSSEEFNNLPEGTHTFTVTAFVVIFDGETPTTIEIKVLRLLYGQ